MIRKPAYTGTPILAGCAAGYLATLAGFHAQNWQFYAIVAAAVWAARGVDNWRIAKADRSKAV